MISRRLLRIKALLVFYAFNRKKGNDLEAAEEELLLSIRKSYDLYHLMLHLITEVADIAEEKIEIARNKKMPTPEDLNPNTKFIDNRLVKVLRANRQLKNYIRNSHLDWTSIHDIPRVYYNKLLGWDLYNEYMASETDSWGEDRKLIIKFMSLLLDNSEDIEGVMEEMSVYWNDDLDFISVMVEKTLRQLKEDSGEEFSLMPIYRSDDDEAFVKKLLRKAILHREEHVDLIDSNTTNWEIERIALMDILVMQLALTEVREFPEIPVKVSLNEYIEIAKFYCTSKSSTFVNGILDKIVKEMRSNKLFEKKGRGLIGEEDKN